MDLAGSAPARVSETGVQRPAVDVVVPFHGTDLELADLRVRLAALRLREGDSLTVVDNRVDSGEGAEPDGERRRVVGAPAVQSSYFARNAGAAGGGADWLVFVDADTDAPPDLLDCYFDELPGPRTAVLAGGVRDAPVEASPTLAERYAGICSLMSQGNTLRGQHGYAQTANCAVLREAFEQVGGFEAGIRSGGDADLCFRLRGLGWEIEPREQAAVLHRSRRTLLGFIRQRARYGAGAAWLAERHPGTFEGVPLRNVAAWSAKCVLRGLWSLARGHRDEAIVCLFDPAGMWALELGRRRGSNAA